MNNELLITKLDTQRLKFDTPQTVLMIGAHPDDIEINAGGLNIMLRENGSNINWLICTDGGGGSWNSNIDRHQLIQVRREEQLKAAAIVGVNRVTLLDFQDGYLAFNQQQLLEAVVGQIRDIKPRLIVTHDPWKRYELHADHRTVGFMVSHAAVMASNSSFLPDRAKHFTKFVGYFNPESANLWVNIDELSDTKDSAISAHKSQFGNRSTLIETFKTGDTNDNFPGKRSESFHFFENR